MSLTSARVELGVELAVSLSQGFPHTVLRIQRSKAESFDLDPIIAYYNMSILCNVQSPFLLLSVSDIFLPRQSSFSISLTHSSNSSNLTRHNSKVLSICLK